MRSIWVLKKRKKRTHDLPNLLYILRDWCCERTFYAQCPQCHSMKFGNLHKRCHKMKKTILILFGLLSMGGGVLAEPINEFTGLTTLSVIALGILNALRPSIFLMIVFLLSMIALIDKNKVLKVGLSFTAGAFSGIYHNSLRLDEPPRKIYRLKVLCCGIWDLSWSLQNSIISGIRKNIPKQPPEGEKQQNS